MLRGKLFKFENMRVVRKSQGLGFFRLGTKADVRLRTSVGVHQNVSGETALTAHKVKMPC